MCFQNLCCRQDMDLDLEIFVSRGLKNRLVSVPEQLPLEYRLLRSRIQDCFLLNLCFGLRMLIYRSRSRCCDCRLVLDEATLAGLKRNQYL